MTPDGAMNDGGKMSRPPGNVTIDDNKLFRALKGAMIYDSMLHRVQDGATIEDGRSALSTGWHNDRRRRATQIRLQSAGRHNDRRWRAVQNARWCDD